jgi:hypothetical protein
MRKVFCVVGLILMTLLLKGESMANPEKLLSRESLVKDTRILVKILEESHPDPYSGGGGRVAFHRRADEIFRAIPAEGLTVRKYLRILRALVASVRDGHTKMYAPGKAEDSRRTWIELEAVEERLYVSGVYREADRPALGGKISSVEGISWEELVKKMAGFRGFDNAYNNLDHLTEVILHPGQLEDLLSLQTPLTEVSLTVEIPAIGRIDLLIPIKRPLPAKAILPPSHITLPPANSADLGWGFLTEDQSVAYLRIDSMMRFREAFEVWRSSGFSTNLGDHLTKVVSSTINGSAPVGINERIAMVPSATEMCQQLFKALREAGSSALVIDLRQNGGGNSVMSLIILHFLGATEAIHNSDRGYQIPRFSSLYFENYRTATLEGRRSQGSDVLELGDLDFTEEIEWRGKKNRDPGPELRLKQNEEIRKYASLSPTFDAEFRKGEDLKSWPGRIVVLSSARTYSAGFDLLTSLFRQGATIIGVPSSQAGNCFIDTLEFTLPNSGLGGSISYKQSIRFPDDPARGEILRPQVELTYDRLASMGFDPNASVLVALEFLSKEKRIQRDQVWPTGASSGTSGLDR